MAETDALRICSAALILLGEASITDFEEGTAAAEACAARFQPVADAMLASHPWRFNRIQRDLSRLEAEPPAGIPYSAGYTLPGNCFRVVVPFVGGCPVTEWTVMEGVLYLDAEASETVTLQFHGRVDEALWPPSFVLALTHKLAGELAVAVRDDAKAAEVYESRSLRSAAMARHQNGTEEPQVAIITGRLAARRLR